ncbi:uncharacterized protein [Cicer arietinum]|uniref:uncharacterized protein n=1 Tax=Cicer arietinum TaxID=3827 RepID=UPI003CC57DF2
MTVSEYSAHFTQLSRHAPYPITEEMRVKRFIRGLKDYLFRSVVGSNCSTFAKVLSLALLIEQRQKEKGGNRQDSHKKQRIEGAYSNYSDRGGGSMFGYQGQQRLMSQRGGHSGQSSGTVQIRRSDSGAASQSTFPQRHSGVSATRCSTCGHIRRDCHVDTTHPSSSYASTPTALASPQTHSASVRQGGNSYVRGLGTFQQRGRGFGGRGQIPAGRGQARVDSHVLFDPGATHSFVSSWFATQLGKCSSSLEEPLVVATPIGGNLLAKSVYRSCDVIIDDKVLPVDLVVIDLIDFDVILGMDWLALHHATLDCHNKVVKFEIPGQPVFSFQGGRSWVPHNQISALAASKLMRRDVFPEELPGLPPDREIEFSIDLVPNTHPISVPLYRMAPAELKELREQLQDLLVTT